MGNRAYDLEQNPKNKVLLAYEEAIGFMCGTQVLDKDGISAAIRATELIAFLETKGRTLNDQLNEIYKEYLMMSLQFNSKNETDQFTFCRYGYHCNRASYFIVTDGRINDTIFHRLRNFDGTPNTVMHNATFI